MDCWEFKKCGSDTYESCPAYPNKGELCWKITGTKCDSGKMEMASLSDKIVFCRGCDFYIQHAKKF